MEVFSSLKTAMVTIPILALPNFKLPFVIETNALDHRLGAVLMQEHKPIVYFSQKLSARAQAKSVYERELTTVVLSV